MVFGDMPVVSPMLRRDEKKSAGDVPENYAQVRLWF
jgi:hypothetical protein